MGEKLIRNGTRAGWLVGWLAAMVMFTPGTGESKPATPAQQTADDSQYVGSETCRTCHEDSYQRWKNTTMGKAFLEHAQKPLEKRACEACHGPGRAHAEGGGGADTIISFSKKTKRPAHELNEQCLQCHEKGNRMFWEGSTHESRGLSCVTCHQVMQPNVPSLRFDEPLTGNRQFVKQTRMEVCFQCHLQRRAQVYRSAHMPFREGKVTCTNCHNPHGTPNPKLLIESSTNETCYKCHAERRGPFLWEHPPVMENCANCHDPHGSARPQMLKVSQPRLCQQCHDVNRHNSTPQLAPTRFAFNRGCTNCHSNIHGSNHPSGVWYQR